MLKGQNSHLGGFDTYQLIWETEMPPLLTGTSGSADPLLPDKSWRPNKVVPPTPETVTSIFQSTGEGTGTADTGPRVCNRNARSFLLHGRKRDKIEPAQLKKIHLQVLNENYSGQLIPAAQEQSWLSKYQTLHEIPPPAMQILQETAALKRLFM